MCMHDYIRNLGYNNLLERKQHILFWKLSNCRLVFSTKRGGKKFFVECAFLYLFRYCYSQCTWGGFGARYALDFENIRKYNYFPVFIVVCMAVPFENLQFLEKLLHNKWNLDICYCAMFHHSSEQLVDYIYRTRYLCSWDYHT